MRLPTEDVISPQLLADSLNVERRYLAELLGVSRDTLDAPSRLTYDIFRRRREISIEAFTFPDELLPINPFGGMTQQVAAQAAELAQHPAANAVEYDELAEADRRLRALDAASHRQHARRNAPRLYLASLRDRAHASDPRASRRG